AEAPLPERPADHRDGLGVAFVLTGDGPPARRNSAECCEQVPGYVGDPRSLRAGAIDQGDPSRIEERDLLKDVTGRAPVFDCSKGSGLGVQAATRVIRPDQR